MIAQFKRNSHKLSVLAIILTITLGLVTLTDGQTQKGEKLEGKKRITLTGSGNVITESRQVRNFDRVSLSGCGELIITQGDQESLMIEAEDNILPYIKTEVKSRTLIISFKNIRLRSIKPIKFNLSIKDIVGLDVSGAGDVRAANIKTSHLDLDISGVGDVVINSLKAEKLAVDLSGTGDCNLSGKVVKQEIDIGGAGEYRAPKLESETARLKISGAGNATTWARDSLDIDISGSGDYRTPKKECRTAKVNISGMGSATVWAHEELAVKITGSGKLNYYGAPSLTIDISGMGSVKSLGNP